MANFHNAAADILSTAGALSKHRVRFQISALLSWRAQVRADPLGGLRFYGDPLKQSVRHAHELD